MHQKSFTIDIYGSRQDIIENQHKIIKTVPHTNINTHVNSQFINSLENISAGTDILVVNLSEAALNELKSLESANIHDKAVIVIGDKKNVDLLSVAISAGVSEFLNSVDYQKDLQRVVSKIILNKSLIDNLNKKRRLNVVINAKGGSGASFIASNVAYKLSQLKDQNVALLDMDLQFGSIGLNFDISPKYTIVEALGEVDKIDYLSMDAYLNKYNDHLKLMLPSAEEIVLPGEIQPESVKSLLYMLQRNYNQIVIDLPRIIDPVFNMILEQADHIAIVVQQTLAQYRDGRRLIQVLNKDLDIPLEKIVVIINRYDPKNSLKKSDMVNVINHNNVFTITNDYERVAAASNIGEPLCQSSPKSKIAKDLKEIALYLGDVKIAQKKHSVISRLKSILF